MAPNGVSATRWLRKLAPDQSQLSPLAAWLVAVSDISERGICVAGRLPHPRRECRVVCFNGRTEAEQIMHEARTRLVVNCRRYNTEKDAVRAAEDLINVYGSSLDRPQRIDDWLFDVIQPEESDESFLNRQADRILGTGVTRIEFYNNEWRA